MKKTIIALILALVMIVMSVTCFAAGTLDVNTADALNELGLFLGTGNGYELEKGLTRAEGVTLLIRMIGMEETAENGVFDNSFTDVPDWAAGYIGYAFANNITNGTGVTTFSPDAAMTDYMFLTLVMRALNYSDKGDASQFVWNNPYALAKELGLIEDVKPDVNFTRADAIKIFWNALDVKLNGAEVTLADRLVEQGVFAVDELADAREIQANGRKENVGIPVIPAPETETPETDTPEIDAPETEAPETDVPETDPKPDEGEVDDGSGPEDSNAGEEDEF